MKIQTSKITIEDEAANIGRAIVLNLCGENPTDAEKWDAIKVVRGELLQASDWTQLGDAVLTLAERADWQNYRQALRDLPQVYASAEQVIFPEVPNGSE
jgi:hypothetical protein